MKGGSVSPVSAKYPGILLLAMLSGICAVMNRPLPFLAGAFAFTYILQPLLWGGVACYVWWLPRVRAAGRLRLRRLLNWLALVCGGFQILFYLAGGMVDGFGRSPYSFTPLGLLNNVVFVGASLIGTELSRSYLINGLGRRRPAFAVGLAGLFFTVLMIPLSQAATLKTYFDGTKFAGSVFFPVLSENVLASYLACLGGPVPALIYRGALLCFQWFCPVLPDLGWIAKTFLGTFIPVFGLLLVKRLYLVESRDIKKAGVEKESQAGWIFTSVVSVLMIWFAVGVFPVFPSVVLSGSMEPGIKKGDIVLVKKLPGDRAVVGDVILFHRDAINITHRVIDVKKGEKDNVYRTRGDANSGPDPEPVSPGQVVGKVVFVAPKIGWATMVLKTVTGGIKPQGVEF